MDHERLKARQRAERHAHHPTNLALPVHRALSWLHRAERLESGGGGDPDKRFLQKLTELDAGRKRFDALVWQEFPSSIRVLLDKHYVFADFWRFHNGTLPEADWKRNFAAANRAPRWPITPGSGSRSAKS
jgi:hypothetical protein